MTALGLDALALLTDAPVDWMMLRAPLPALAAAQALIDRALRAAERRVGALGASADQADAG